MPVQYDVELNSSTSDWVSISFSVNSNTNELTFFHNGQSIHTSHGVSNMSFDTTSNVCIGSNINDSSIAFNTLNGSMYDIQIYDSTLSSASVQENYDKVVTKYIQPNSWNHLVMNFDSSLSNVETYLNGTNIGTFVDYIPQKTSNQNFISPLTIGGQYFYGSVGEVVVAERILSSYEIDHLVNNQTRWSEPTTLFHYQFTETQLESVVCKDIGELQIDGTLDIKPTNNIQENGRCLDLSVDQTITIPASSDDRLALYDLNRVTLSMYIKVSESQNTIALISFVNNFGIELNTNTGSPQTLFLFWFEADTGIKQTLELSSVPQLFNRFTHFALHIDAKNSVCVEYIDFALIATHSIPNLNIKQHNEAVTIGGFNAYLVDVRADVCLDTQLPYKPFEFKPMLILDWSFDESSGTVVNDGSEFDNHGTLTVDTQRTLDTYMPGAKGVSFDGTQSMNITGSMYTNMVFDGFSFSCWVKRTVDSSNMELLRKDTAFSLKILASGRIQLSTPSGHQSYESNGVLKNVGEWSHIGVVLNIIHQKITFYIDGVTDSNSTITDITEFVFNDDIDYVLSSTFIGELDSVRIYAGSLDPHAITELYRSNVHRQMQIDSGEWSHIATTYNERMNMICTYVNGNYNGCYETYLQDFLSVGSNNEPTYIGTDILDGVLNNKFDGILDDIRVYNKALTHQNIKQIYSMYSEMTLDLIQSVTPTMNPTSITVEVTLNHDSLNMMNSIGNLVTTYIFISNRKASNDVSFRLFLENKDGYSVDVDYAKIPYTKPTTPVLSSDIVLSSIDLSTCLHFPLETPYNDRSINPSLNLWGHPKLFVNVVSVYTNDSTNLFKFLSKNISELGNVNEFIILRSAVFTNEQLHFVYESEIEILANITSISVEAAFFEENRSDVTIEYYYSNSTGRFLTPSTITTTYEYSFKRVGPNVATDDVYFHLTHLTCKGSDGTDLLYSIELIDTNALLIGITPGGTETLNDILTDSNLATGLKYDITTNPNMNASPVLLFTLKTTVPITSVEYTWFNESYAPAMEISHNSTVIGPTPAGSTGGTGQFDQTITLLSISHYRIATTFTLSTYTDYYGNIDQPFVEGTTYRTLFVYKVTNALDEENTYYDDKTALAITLSIQREPYIMNTSGGITFTSESPVFDLEPVSASSYEHVIMTSSCIIHQASHTHVFMYTDSSGTISYSSSSTLNLTSLTSSEFTIPDDLFVLYMVSSIGGTSTLCVDTTNATINCFSTSIDNMNRLTSSPIPTDLLDAEITGINFPVIDFNTKSVGGLSPHPVQANIRSFVPIEFSWITETFFVYPSISPTNDQRCDIHIYIKNIDTNTYVAFEVLDQALQLVNGTMRINDIRIQGETILIFDNRPYVANDERTVSPEIVIQFDSIKVYKYVRYVAPSVPPTNILETFGGEQLSFDGSGTFENSDSTRTTYNSSSQTLTTSGMVHLLSVESFQLPLYVECEMQNTDSQAVSILLANNMGTSTNTNMKYEPGTVAWGTGSFTDDYTVGMNGTTLRQNDSTSSNSKKMSVYVDENVIIMFDDNVEKYRFSKNDYTFPDWAVAGGTVRVGIWSWDKGTYNNFKVIPCSNPNFFVHQPNITQSTFVLKQVLDINSIFKHVHSINSPCISFNSNYLVITGVDKLNPSYLNTSILKYSETESQYESLVLNNTLSVSTSLESTPSLYGNVIVFPSGSYIEITDTGLNTGSYNPNPSSVTNTAWVSIFQNQVIHKKDSFQWGHQAIVLDSSFAYDRATLLTTTTSLPLQLIQSVHSDYESGSLSITISNDLSIYYSYKNQVFPDIFGIVPKPDVLTCKTLLSVYKLTQPQVKLSLQNNTYTNESSISVTAQNTPIGFRLNLNSNPLVQVDIATTFDRKLAHRAFLYVGIFINGVDLDRYDEFIVHNKEELDSPVKLTINNVVYNPTNNWFDIDVIFFSIEQTFVEYEIAIFDNDIESALFTTYSLTVGSNQIVSASIQHPQPSPAVSIDEHTVVIRVTIDSITYYSEPRTFSKLSSIEPFEIAFNTFSVPTHLSNTTLNQIQTIQNENTPLVNTCILADDYLIQQTHASVFTINRLTPTHTVNNYENFNQDLATVDSFSSKRIFDEGNNPYNVELYTFNYTNTFNVYNNTLADFSMETLLFNAKTFQKSNEGSLNYLEGGTTLYTSGTRTLLSLKRFTLPLYVECELKLGNSYTSILIGNGYEYGDIVHGGISHDINTIKWGTGMWNGSSNVSFSLYINGTEVSLYETDPTRTEYKIFALYITEDTVIAYHNGIEKYRFTSDTTPFPDWAVSGGSVRVGTYTYNQGYFRNFKVGHSNPYNPYNSHKMSSHLNLNFPWQRRFDCSLSAIDTYKQEIRTLMFSDTSAKYMMRMDTSSKSIEVYETELLFTHYESGVLDLSQPLGTALISINDIEFPTFLQSSTSSHQQGAHTNAGKFSINSSQASTNPICDRNVSWITDKFFCYMHVKHTTDTHENLCVVVYNKNDSTSAWEYLQTIEIPDVANVPRRLNDVSIRGDTIVIFENKAVSYLPEEDPVILRKIDLNPETFDISYTLNSPQPLPAYQNLTYNTIIPNSSTIYNIDSIAELAINSETHILSHETFTIPLYVECEICTNKTTVIHMFASDEVFWTDTNFHDSGVNKGVSFGINGINQEKSFYYFRYYGITDGIIAPIRREGNPAFFAYPVKNIKHTDDVFSKISVFIDDHEIIMYAEEGKEVHRIQRSEHDLIKDKINGKIGLYSQSNNTYIRNFRVSNRNPWIQNIPQVSVPEFDKLHIYKVNNNTVNNAQFVRLQTESMSNITSYNDTNTQTSSVLYTLFNGSYLTFLTSRFNDRSSTIILTESTCSYDPNDPDLVTFHTDDDPSVYTTTGIVDVKTSTPHYLPIYFECDVIGDMGILLAHSTTSYEIEHQHSGTVYDNIKIDFFLEEKSTDSRYIIFAEMEIFDSSGTGNKLYLDPHLQKVHFKPNNNTNYSRRSYSEFWYQMVDGKTNVKPGYDDVNDRFEVNDKIFTLTVPYNTDKIKIYYNRPRWTPKWRCSVNGSSTHILVDKLYANGTEIAYDNNTDYTVYDDTDISTLQSKIPYHLIEGISKQIPKRIAVYMDESKEVLYEDDTEISSTHHSTPLSPTTQFFLGTRTTTTITSHLLKYTINQNTLMQNSQKTLAAKRKLLMSATTCTPSDASKITFSSDGLSAYTTTDVVDVLTNNAYPLPIYIECEYLNDLRILLSPHAAPSEPEIYYKHSSATQKNIDLDFFIQEFSYDDYIIFADIQIFDSNWKTLKLDPSLQQLHYHSFHQATTENFWYQLTDGKTNVRPGFHENVVNHVSLGDKLFTLTVPYNTDKIKIYYNRPLWSPKWTYSVNGSSTHILVDKLYANATEIAYDTTIGYELLDYLDNKDISDVYVQSIIPYHLIEGISTQVPKRVAIYVDESKTVFYEDDVEVSQTPHASTISTNFKIGTRSGATQAMLLSIQQGIFSMYSNPQHKVTTISSLVYDDNEKRFTKWLPNTTNVIPTQGGEFVSYPSMYGNLITYTTSTPIAQYVHTLRMVPNISSPSFEVKTSSTFTKSNNVIASYFANAEHVYLVTHQNDDHKLSRFEIGASTVQSTPKLTLQNLNIDVINTATIDTLASPPEITFTLHNVDLYTELTFYLLITNTFVNNIENIYQYETIIDKLINQPSYYKSLTETIIAPHDPDTLYTIQLPDKIIDEENLHPRNKLTMRVTSKESTVIKIDYIRLSNITNTELAFQITDQSLSTSPIYFAQLSTYNDDPENHTEWDDYDIDSYLELTLINPSEEITKVDIVFYEYACSENFAITVGNQTIHTNRLTTPGNISTIPLFADVEKVTVNFTHTSFPLNMSLPYTVHIIAKNTLDDRIVSYKRIEENRDYFDLNGLLTIDSSSTLWTSSNVTTSFSWDTYFDTDKTNYEFQMKGFASYDSNLLGIRFPGAVEGNLEYNDPENVYEETKQTSLWAAGHLSALGVNKPEIDTHKVKFIIKSLTSSDNLLDIIEIRLSDFSGKILSYYVDTTSSDFTSYNVENFPDDGSSVSMNSTDPNYHTTMSTILQNYNQRIVLNRNTSQYQLDSYFELSVDPEKAISRIEIVYYKTNRSEDMEITSGNFTTFVNAFRTSDDSHAQPSSSFDDAVKQTIIIRTQPFAQCVIYDHSTTTKMFISEYTIRNNKNIVDVVTTDSLNPSECITLLLLEDINTKVISVFYTGPSWTSIYSSTAHPNNIPYFVHCDKIQTDSNTGSRSGVRSVGICDGNIFVICWDHTLLCYPKSGVSVLSTFKSNIDQIESDIHSKVKRFTFTTDKVFSVFNNGSLFYQYCNTTSDFILIHVPTLHSQIHTVLNGTNHIRVLTTTSDNESSKWFGVGQTVGLGIDSVTTDTTIEVNTFTYLYIINDFLEKPGNGLKPINDYVIGGGDDIFIIDKTNKKVWFYTTYMYPYSNIHVKDLLNEFGRKNHFVEVHISLIDNGTISIDDIITIKGRHTLFITTHRSNHVLQTKNQGCFLVRNQSTNRFHRDYTVVNTDPDTITSISTGNTYPFENYDTTNTNFILSRIQIGKHVEYKPFELAATQSDLDADLLSTVSLTITDFNYKTINVSLSNLTNVEQVGYILSTHDYSDADLNILEPHMINHIRTTNLVSVDASGNATLDIQTYLQENVLNRRCVSVHSSKRHVSSEQCIFPLEEGALSHSELLLDHFGNKHEIIEVPTEFRNCVYYRMEYAYAIDYDPTFHFYFEEDTTVYACFVMMNHNDRGIRNRVQAYINQHADDGFVDVSMTEKTIYTTLPNEKQNDFNHTLGSYYKQYSKQFSKGDVYYPHFRPVFDNDVLLDDLRNTYGSGPVFKYSYHPLYVFKPVQSVPSNLSSSILSNMRPLSAQKVTLNKTQKYYLYLSAFNEYGQQGTTKLEKLTFTRDKFDYDDTQSLITNISVSVYPTNASFDEQIQFTLTFNSAFTPIAKVPLASYKIYIFLSKLSTPPPDVSLFMNRNDFNDITYIMFDVDGLNNNLLPTDFTITNPLRYSQHLIIDPTMQYYIHTCILATSSVFTYIRPFVHNTDTYVYNNETRINDKEVLMQYYTFTPPSTPRVDMDVPLTFTLDSQTEWYIELTVDNLPTDCEYYLIVCNVPIEDTSMNYVTEHDTTTSTDLKAPHMMLTHFYDLIKQKHLNSTPQTNKVFITEYFDPLMRVRYRTKYDQDYYIYSIIIDKNTRQMSNETYYLFHSNTIPRPFVINQSKTPTYVHTDVRLDVTSYTRNLREVGTDDITINCEMTSSSGSSRDVKAICFDSPQTSPDFTIISTHQHQTQLTTVTPFINRILFSTSTFDLSRTSYVIDTSFDSNSIQCINDKMHILTKQTYQLPLYVECTIRSINNICGIYIGHSMKSTSTNIHSKGISDIIWWGTGYSNLYYGYNVSGNMLEKSEDNRVVDETARNAAKFSIYVDHTEIILYQHEGVERFRFSRTLYPEFWDTYTKSDTCKIGLYSYNDSEHTDFKVGNYNPWTLNIQKFQINSIPIKTIDDSGNVSDIASIDPSALYYMYIGTAPYTQFDTFVLSPDIQPTHSFVAKLDGAGVGYFDTSGGTNTSTVIVGTNPPSFDLDTVFNEERRVAKDGTYTFDTDSVFLPEQSFVVDFCIRLTNILNQNALTIIKNEALHSIGYPNDVMCIRATSDDVRLQRLNTLDLIHLSDKFSNRPGNDPTNHPQQDDSEIEYLRITIAFVHNHLVKRYHYSGQTAYRIREKKLGYVYNNKTNDQQFSIGDNTNNTWYNTSLNPPVNNDERWFDQFVAMHSSTSNDSKWAVNPGGLTDKISMAWFNVYVEDSIVNDEIRRTFGSHDFVNRLQFQSYALKHRSQLEEFTGIFETTKIVVPSVTPVFYRLKFSELEVTNYSSQSQISQLDCAVIVWVSSQDIPTNDPTLHITFHDSNKVNFTNDSYQYLITEYYDDTDTLIHIMSGVTHPDLYVYSRLRDTKTGEYGPVQKGVVQTSSLYPEEQLIQNDYKIDLYIEDYVDSNSSTINGIHLYTGSRELTTFTISDTTSSDHSGFPKTWDPFHLYGMHLLTIHPEMIVTKIKIIWSDNQSSFGLNVTNAYNAQTFYATALDFTVGEAGEESYHEIDFQKGRILYKMSEADEPFVQETHPLHSIQITDIPLNALTINPASPVTNITTTNITTTSITLTWTQTSDNDIPTTMYTIQYSKIEPTWDNSEQTAAGTTSYNVTNLDASTLYYFRIIKENAFSKYVGAGQKYANVVSTEVQQSTST